MIFEKQDIIVNKLLPLWNETYDTENIMQRIAGYGGTCLPYKGL